MKKYKVLKLIFNKEANTELKEKMKIHFILNLEESNTIILKIQNT